MYFLATGVFTDRSKLAPLLQAEKEKLRELKQDGVIAHSYYRPDGGGVVFILQVADAEDARKRMAEFPFVQAGLLLFEYAELALL